MDAMYGKRSEDVETLLEKLKSNASSFVWEDYDAAVNSGLGEAEYRAMASALEKGGQRDLLQRIAADWNQRDPESIPAWQEYVNALRSLRRDSEADTLQRDRLVEVEFEVRLPETEKGSQPFLTGNAEELGGWKPDTIALKCGSDGLWRTRCQVPKGRLEFKITKGTWETVETRADGRSTSNRRARVSVPNMTIRATVEAFSTGDKK
jgi:hypothetical protein